MRPSASAVFLLLLSVPSFGEPPGLSVAASDPQVEQITGNVSCAEGRFIPLNMSPGKPALMMGNEAGYLTIYPLGPGEAVHGIRYDEPVGAKTKRYTFPKGANYYAVANTMPPGVAPATITLISVVNGEPTKEEPSKPQPPTVAGKLVITLTAAHPPPPPITLTATPSTGNVPLTVQFTSTGDTSGGVLEYGDGSSGSVPASHVYAAAGTYTAKLTAAGKTASAVVVVAGAPVPPVVTSFRVIYVTESSKNLTQTQNAVINAADTVSYLNSKCTKTNNWPDFRHYDPQTKGEKDYPGLANLWAATKPAITTVPCVIIQVNDKATIEPFPATVADAMTLFRKYGGSL